MIASVIDRIQLESPEGGFVKQDHYSGRWYQLRGERVRDKVGHAIRKGSIRRRNKMKKKNKTKPSKGDEHSKDASKNVTNESDDEEASIGSSSSAIGDGEEVLSPDSDDNDRNVARNETKCEAAAAAPAQELGNPCISAFAPSQALNQALGGRGPQQYLAHPSNPVENVNRRNY